MLTRVWPAPLAPGVELPGDKIAQIGDFLLGQQNGKPRQATRRMLKQSDGAREWASAVAAELQGVEGASLPDLPPASGAEGRRRAGGRGWTRRDASRDAGRDRRPRPCRRRPPPPSPPSARARRGRPGRREPATPASPRSSRLGGALLIGAVVLALVALLLWLFVFSGDDDEGADPAGSASPTATATATPQPVGQLELKGTGAASKATGRIIFYLQGQQLLFALEAQNLPQTKQNEKYALWLTGGAKAKWMGDTPSVTADGNLTVAGPGQEGADAFARDFAAHRNIVLTRETSTQRTRPGRTLMRGTLPSGQ